MFWISSRIIEGIGGLGARQRCSTCPGEHDLYCAGLLCKNMSVTWVKMCDVLTKYRVRAFPRYASILVVLCVLVVLAAPHIALHETLLWTSDPFFKLSSLFSVFIYVSHFTCCPISGVDSCWLLRMYARCAPELRYTEDCQLDDLAGIGIRLTRYVHWTQHGHLTLDIRGVIVGQCKSDQCPWHCQSPVALLWVL